MVREVRILLVEDDDFEARAIQNYFSKEVIGYVVVGTAVCVDSAMEAILDQRPDVVVLDYTLKGSIGSDLIPWIKEHRLIEPKPYILMFTAILDRGKKEALRDMGAHEMLCKGAVETNPPMLYRHLRDFYPYFLKETKQQEKLNLPVVSAVEERSRLERRIISDLERMGIVGDYKGRRHMLQIIRDSVIKKDKYPEFMAHYKSIAQVEKCNPHTVSKRIEYCIEVAFSNDFYETTKEIYPPEYGANRAKPSNGRFMRYFIVKFIEEGYE